MRQLIPKITLFMTSRCRRVMRFFNCMDSRTTTRTRTTMAKPAKMAPATK